MRSPSFLAAVPILLLSGTSFAAAAKVVAPKAPTNLTVKPVGVNSFKLAWKDNSTNEAGWEILVALKGGKPTRYILLPGINLTSYTLSTINNELPGKELVFQIRAYAGVAGKEKFSKKTPTVSASAFPSSTFGDPTKLVAKAVDDGQISLTWKDNATSENGYVLEYKKTSDKKWSSLGGVSPDMKYKVNTKGFFKPATSYSFRVRAYKGNPGIATKYSNVAEVKTKRFQGPSGLVVTPGKEGLMSFKWKDRSSVEGGYELQFKAPSKDFSSLNYAADTTSVPNVGGADLDAKYQFRVRAYRMDGTKKIYTAFTSTVTATTTSLISPTDLVTSAPTDTSVTLTWKSTSTRSTGYNIQYRVVGTTDYTSVNPGKVLTYKVNNLVSGKNYEFRVRGSYAASFSGFTGNSQGRTKEGFIGGMTPPIVVGERFLFPLRTSLPSGVTNLTVGTLPAGLVFNSATGTITGTLATAGTYTITLTVTFSDGTVTTRQLTLKSSGKEPVIAQVINPTTVTKTTPKTISLAGRFSDADTQSAARVVTTKGTFDIILFPDATPATVDNFLDYVDGSVFDGSFFHRSLSNFVAQAGGYKHTTAAGFTKVVTFPAVTNEPGLSNVRGTVAMAKLPGLPNSATSQFFVNTGDNTANLDAQNGGFTVFGRVPASGMAVVDVINDLPTGDYDVPIGSGTELLEDLPVDAASAPVSLDPAQLVKITSIDAAPILIYQVSSQNTSIATVALEGTDSIKITGVSAGITTIEVKATDLDGNSVTQSVTVTVP